MIPKVANALSSGKCRASSFAAKRWAVGYSGAFLAAKDDRLVSHQRCRNHKPCHPNEMRGTHRALVGDGEADSDRLVWMILRAISVRKASPKCFIA